VNADIRGFWLLRPDGTRTVAWDYFSRLLAAPAKSAEITIDAGGVA
jgi:hypothetical protein